MKRVFAIISVLSILACLFVPVSADGWYSDYISSVFHVLDYATPNDSLDNSINVNNGDSVIFDIPNNMYFSYVDILFSSSGSAIKSVTVNGFPMAITDYGHGIRRICGDISNQRYNTFELVFETYGTCRMNFLKFDAVPMYQSPVPILGNFLYSIGAADSGFIQQTDLRVPVSFTYPADPTPESNTDYIDWGLNINATQWVYYDYLTFLFYTDLNISSITAMGQYGSIPITTNIFDLGGSSDKYNDKIIQVTIDLTRYDKSSESIPVINIRADQYKNRAGTFQLNEVLGFIDIQYPNPILSFLRKLGSDIGDWFHQIDSTVNTFQINVGTWFDELAASITGVFEYDTQESEDDKAALENQSSQIDYFNSQMEDVTYPDISHNDIMINEVYPGDVSYSVTPFNAVFNNHILLSIFTMSLTLALASYVLYGKR